MIDTILLLVIILPLLLWIYGLKYLDRKPADPRPLDFLISYVFP